MADVFGYHVERNVSFFFFFFFLIVKISPHLKGLREENLFFLLIKCLTWVFLTKCNQCMKSLQSTLLRRALALSKICTCLLKLATQKAWIPYLLLGYSSYAIKYQDQGKHEMFVLFSDRAFILHLLWSPSNPKFGAKYLVKSNMYIIFETLGLKKGITNKTVAKATLNFFWRSPTFAINHHGTEQDLLTVTFLWISIAGTSTELICNRPFNSFLFIFLAFSPSSLHKGGKMENIFFLKKCKNQCFNL